MNTITRRTAAEIKEDRAQLLAFFVADDGNHEFSVYARYGESELQGLYGLNRPESALQTDLKALVAAGKLLTSKGYDMKPQDWLRASIPVTFTNYRLNTKETA